MKSNSHQSDSTSQTFLTGTILFANLDYSGLEAYAIKAAIGAAIWMVFKLTGDYLSAKYIQQRNRRESSQQKDQFGNND